VLSKNFASLTCIYCITVRPFYNRATIHIKVLRTQTIPISPDSFFILHSTRRFATGTWAGKTIGMVGLGGPRLNRVQIAVAYSVELNPAAMSSGRNFPRSNAHSRNY
jgi:hypothetical protein